MTYKGKKINKIYSSAEGYDLWASHYDKTLSFLDSLEGNALNLALRCVEGKKVLDLGCGTGRGIKHLYDFKAAEVCGVDVSKKMLEIAKKKFKNTEFVLADSEKLPFEDESFDVVTGLFLIVHLGDLRKTFDEAYRVLKNGGVFILSNINQRKPPKLKIYNDEVIIDSFYHMPKHVIEALEASFFEIESDELVYEDGIWINQIIKAVKKA
ncbi:class I SAM-dependent methyltransferase [Candidatus Gracilibacteria bacterium]|jgi:ubiquinone/menaquinone biosynthesis C-methylase UbiE|nr:class I SAM-dependent methyltransferase [Candidatus Gracilibacteria bacterium]